MYKVSASEAYPRGFQCWGLIERSEKDLGVAVFAGRCDPADALAKSAAASYAEKLEAAAGDSNTHAAGLERRL